MVAMETTFHGRAQPHLRETGQDSGWAVLVLDGGGNVVTDLVVRGKDIGPDGDEAAIRDALAEHYDVTDLRLTRGTERDDDELEHPVIRFEGLRKN